MQTTLYTTSGKPVAYIDHSDDNSIFLWNGRSVAYLDNETIYGWKGKHIGWFIKGTMYDTKGKIVGYTKETSPVITYIESVKFVKHVKHVRYTKHSAYTKPTLSYSKSQTELEDFLKQNSTYY